MGKEEIKQVDMDKIYVSLYIYKQWLNSNKKLTFFL